MKRKILRNWIFIPLVASSVFTLFFSIQGFNESALSGFIWLIVSTLLVGIEIVWGIRLHIRLLTRQDRPLSTLSSYLYTAILPPAVLGVLFGTLLIGGSWLLSIEWVAVSGFLFAGLISSLCLSFIYHIGYQDSFIRCSNWLKEQMIPIQYVIRVQRIIWRLYRITCNIQGRRECYYFHLAEETERAVFQELLMSSRQKTCSQCVSHRFIL